MARMNGTIGFEEDVRPLFRQGDRDCMLANSFPPFDLWQWSNVRDAGDRISERLALGDMPPDAPWPAQQVELFKSWLAEGAPLRRGEAYAAFYRDLDSYTEYWDVYRPDTQGQYMRPVVQQIFPNVLTPWRNYAIATDAERDARLQELMEVIGRPEVRAAIELIDDLLDELVRRHFSANGNVDASAVLEAQMNFGLDRLPLDPDRDGRIAANDQRKPFAKYHRMDGAIMWFNWAAHLESAFLLRGEDARHTSRTLLMAGVCGGCSMDFTFRDNRLPTRPEYRRDDATERIIRDKTSQLSRSWDSAAQEGSELFGIAARPFMPNKFFSEGLGRLL